MTTPAQVDYTKRDYESLRSELISKIPGITSEWTDRNYSDLGIVLLELFVGAVDMLQYYQDRKANECFLETAQERISVIRICRAIGYELNRQAAATAELTFTLESARAVDVDIPRFTQVSNADTESPVRFVTWEAATIAAGELTTTVSARQGELRTEAFSGTGAADQYFKLGQTDIAELPLEITVAGEEWEEVEDFVDSDPDDTHFRVETDDQGYVRVYFGDGVTGAIPASGEEIVVKYLSTLGADGNLGAGLITVISDEITDGDGATVGDTSVTNAASATGGAAEETIEEAKINAPASLRALYRMMDPEGIEALIQTYPGVARVQVVDRNSSADIARYYRIVAYVAPEGGGDLPALLREDLEAYILEKKVRPMDIRVEEATYVPVNVTASIYVHSAYRSATVRQAVVAVVNDFFDLAEGDLDFTDGVTAAEIGAVINDVDGVSYSVVTSADVECSEGEIPIAGTVTVTVAGVV
jgi:hypothetical protein